MRNLLLFCYSNFRAWRISGSYPKLQYIVCVVRNDYVYPASNNRRPRHDLALAVDGLIPALDIGRSRGVTQLREYRSAHRVCPPSHEPHPTCAARRSPEAEAPPRCQNVVIIHFAVPPYSGIYMYAPPFGVDRSSVPPFTVICLPCTVMSLTP